MYCNLTKSQSFPLVFAKPTMLKQIYTSKPQSLLESSSKHLNFSLKSVKESHCLNEMGSFGMLRRTFRSGVCIKNAILDRKFVVARGLCSSSSQRVGEGSGKTRFFSEEGGFGEGERSKSVVMANVDDETPWEVAVENFLKETSPSVEFTDEGVNRSRSRRGRDGGGGGPSMESTDEGVNRSSGRRGSYRDGGGGGPSVEFTGEGVNRSRGRRGSYRDGGGGGDGSKKSTPWLKEKSREITRHKSVVTTNANKSTWEVSAERYLKGGNAEEVEVDGSRSRDSGGRDGDVGGDGSEQTLPWLAQESSREVKRNESVVATNADKSPLEVSGEKYLKGGPVKDEEVYMSRSRYTSFRDGERDKNGDDGSRSRYASFRDGDRYKDGDDGSRSRYTSFRDGDRYKDGSRSRYTSFRDGDRNKDGDDGSEGEEEVEDFEHPRWDKMKTRFHMEDEARPVAESPELRRWNKQENWGKKIWKEATESTVPKLSGEAIYGVGPVLAAVCAGRRELYALYVQEGLDLSSNNRKKKDKKGVEKILRMAEKIGLTKSEASKHDLNMVSDNRPHQGLVLDASPLEMVGIKELEPVSVDEENIPLWVALDEVTDPQNLGAIIRSSYFFGASGVVLCAKNSAPLSGVVSKASAGSLEMVELRSCKNMMQFLTSSAENGWRVIGGSVSPRAVPLDEIAPGAPTIIVLGSEGTGLRPLVERSCSQLVKIPGNAPLNLVAEADEEAKSAEAGEQFQAHDFRSFMAVESLNVSVAAGVLLHHFIGLNYKHNNPIQETK